MSVIEVTDLKKSFGGKVVLNGISFSVEKGEVFGFLGPNGAGKTTTMRILLGLLHAGSGSARVKGADLAVNDAVRGKVGVLLENNGIYDRLSAYENLFYYAQLYGVENPGDRIGELLEFTGLSERKDDPAGTFSTGMKRKLGIARAILHDPEIVFLDEPSSGLDPEAQHMVRDLILRLSGREGITIFLNSHNLDEVQRVCNRVAILNQGEIKALDSVSTLTTGAGMTVFGVTLSDKAQAGAAQRVLEGIAGVSDLQVQGDHISMKIPHSGAPGVLFALTGAGISLEEAKKQSRSLEDIYLDVMKKAEASP